MEAAPFEKKEFGAHLHGWIRSGPKRPRAVVFIHGFTGDLENTWTATTDTSFMQLIMQDDALNDFDVFSFGYASGVLRSAPPIDNIVQQFRNAATKLFDDYQVVLCGHSMGGLVCMQHIITELSNGRSLPIVGLVLYGTPIEGSAWVNVTKIVLGISALKFWWLSFVAKYVFRNKSQLASLGIASDFLHNLRSRWARHVVHGGDPLLASNLRAAFPVRVVSGNEDLIVGESSAKSFFGDLDWYPVQYGHIEMVKPTDHQQESYVALQSFLIECRYSDTPAIRARLRQLSERILAQRGSKLIKNWVYQVECFNRDQAPENTLPWDPTLKNAGFCVTRILQCQYQTLISGQPYTIAFAFGKAAESDAWSANPAYVHFLHVDVLPKETRSAITTALDHVIKTSPTEDAWDAVFRGVEFCITDKEGKNSIKLLSDKPTIANGVIARNFRIPENAKHLIDREGVISLGFDTIRPDALTDISIEFPWMTYLFKCDVTIHGKLDVLHVADHLFPDEKFDQDSEQLGIRSKISFRSPDLILPDSFIRIRWHEESHKE